MNMIIHTILQEKQRIESMLARYKAELETLPKGTISEKRVGEKRYYYLKYRKDKKVVSQYIGKDELDNVREQLNKRKHIEGIIASLAEEKRIADRALEGIV